MDGVTPPAINWESENLDEEWSKFEEHARLMFLGPLSGKSEKIQCAYLLIWIGEKGRDIFKTFDIEADDANKIEPYLLKFREYAAPKKNKVFARYIFQKRDQRDGETLEKYITELKLLVKPCEYHDPKEMTRDKIVCGIRNPRI